MPVWMRDEWSVTRVGGEEGGRRGRRREPDRLRLPPEARGRPDQETLSPAMRRPRTPCGGPTPQTDEGRAAQRAMQTRSVADERAADGICSATSSPTLASSREAAPKLTTSSLRDAVETAAKRSLIRLFPKFARATTPTGGRSSRRPATAPPTRSTPSATTASRRPTRCARKCSPRSAPGAPRAPTSRSASPRRRSAGRRTPSTEPSSPCSRLGNIRAAQDGKDLGGPKELPPTQIGKVTLYKEDEPPTIESAPRRAGAPDGGGDPLRAGQEGAADPGPPPAAQGPRRPRRRCAAASRAARHRPPRRASRSWEATSGSARSPTTTSASGRTSTRGGPPTKRARSASASGANSAACSATPTDCPSPTRSRRRSPPSAMVASSSTSPIRSRRSSQSSTAALRAEVKGRAQKLADAQRAAVAELEAWDEWGKLRARTTGSASSPRQARPDRRRPTWAPRRSCSRRSTPIPLRCVGPTGSRFVPSRRDQARQRAAKKLEPESVARHATVGDHQDRRRARDRTSTQLRALVQSHLDAGKTVII